MIPKDQVVDGEELLKYVVGSGDMRCIDIAERAVILRQDPEIGQIVRGEFPECDPGTYSDLSFILLEYVMSCDDRRETERISKAADEFGRRLGRKIIEFCDFSGEEESGPLALERSVSIVLNSMDASYETSKSEAQIIFELPDCPLHAAAARSGLTLWIPLAHRSFVALLEQLVTELAPDWKLQLPAERQTDSPIEKILFSRSGSI